MENKKNKKEKRSTSPLLTSFVSLSLPVKGGGGRVVVLFVLLILLFLNTLKHNLPILGQWKTRLVVFL